MLRKVLNPWVVIVGIFLACGLLGLTIAGLVMSKPDSSSIAPGTALLNVIQAPTATVPVTPALPTNTPTPEGATPPNPPPGEIVVGGYVQIVGTGTDGLRLRSDPSLQSDVRFVGIEAEVFKVTEGPREADGYTWWHLVEPYNENVQGWAVANYLGAIQQP